MTKRKIIFVSVVCFLIVVFAVRTPSQTRSSALKAKQSDAESRTRSELDHQQRRKEFQERVAKIKKEFLYEKHALRVSEEQWKVIKAKLEEVRKLRDEAR